MKLYQFIIMLSLAACGGASAPEPEVKVPDTTNAGTLSYLALGDSYTIGQSVEIAERWPVILANDLKKAGKPVRTPEIIATTGWTTRDLLNALDQKSLLGPYDLVSLLIGVNNQYQGRSIDEFRTQFRELLARSITYAGGEPGHVFVLSIPDWGVTPFGDGHRDQIARDIDRFNAVAKEECDARKIKFLDITPISREALNDASMIASDQLHFSGKMYQRWVDAILPQVKPLLK